MAEIIVIGHGGYGEGVRTNLEMVTGVPECMHFLNFTKDQDRAELGNYSEHPLFKDEIRMT